MDKELRINKSAVTHLILTKRFEGINNGYHTKKYYWLPEKVEKFLWWVDGVYPEGFYHNSLRNSIWGSHYGEFKADFTLEELNKSKRYYEHTQDSMSPPSVWTKDNVEVYCGKLLLETYYFENYSEVRSFCDKEFPNINLIEK